MSNTESGNQLIQRFRSDYQAALSALDTEVGDLVKNGKEMRAINTAAAHLARIVEIRDQLESFYSAIFRTTEILKKFGSVRLQQCGHELLPTMGTLVGDVESKEEYILTTLRKVGYTHNHWFIKERILVEIDYMLDALDILVEPDFMPIASATDSDGEPDRRIPSDVKISVWRRDEGECVKCASQQRLEYDHIIPVSKGGSNTERNIQLLCEKCNREKATSIQ